MMLLGSSKETFNGFFSFVIESLISIGVTNILTDFYIVIPNMLSYNFNFVCTFRTLIQIGTLSAIRGAAFVFPVTVSVGCGIL